MPEQKTDAGSLDAIAFEVTHGLGMVEAHWRDPITRERCEFIAPSGGRDFDERLVNALRSCILRGAEIGGG